MATPEGWRMRWKENELIVFLTLEQLEKYGPEPLRLWLQKRPPRPKRGCGRVVPFDRRGGGE